MRCLSFLAIISAFNDCTALKSGIFDNVTVFVKGAQKQSLEHLIFIEFDDFLSPHLINKPSEIITISHQFIPKLETNSIANLPRVRNLTLTFNQIREIRKGAFNDLPNLKVLNLSHNEIEEVRQGYFNDLPMEALYLNNNKICRVGYKAFSHLHLKKLFLNNNKIARWSKDWLADSSVRVLDMSYNLIEELPPNSFHLMAQPVNGSMSLIFSGNQLKRIDNHVFNGLKKFRRIFLDSNSIRELSGGVFEGVKYINTLNLNNNSLAEVKSEVLRNVQIDVLMLEDNKLTCVSTDIFHMEELDIDGNPITCFCVQKWLEWRDHHSNPSIYHITNLEQECI